VSGHLSSPRQRRNAASSAHASTIFARSASDSDTAPGSRHDVLAARPQAVLQAIAKFTSRAAERA